MDKVIKISVFLGLYSCCFCSDVISDQRNDDVTRNQGGSLVNPGYQALIQAARDGFSRSEINRFAPDTPPPNDVECYVDVETIKTERIGGRCVTFGRSNLRLCQAGEFSGPFLDNQCRIQQTDQPTP